MEGILENLAPFGNGEGVSQINPNSHLRPLLGNKFRPTKNGGLDNILGPNHTKRVLLPKKILEKRSLKFWREREGIFLKKGEKHLFSKKRENFPLNGPPTVCGEI